MENIYLNFLNRKQINPDNDEIGRYITNKTILVTGGGGSIGAELCRKIMKYQPSKLIILDIYENNAYDIQTELKQDYPDECIEIVIASVRDKSRMEAIFDKYRPYIVFHAAAHKHVPLMEDNPAEAIKNNVFGTLNTALCADKFGANRFVLISTDKAVNPTNIMGATKRICEIIIRSLQCRSTTIYTAVRFGNVIGSNGSVIPLFKKQIERGGPVTVTDKRITRFFMTITEAVQLILQAASYADGGEIYVLDMGKPINIYDLAKKCIRFFGKSCDKDIKIEICGLRPGEKLNEELYYKDETPVSTKHEKIFVVHPNCIDSNELSKMLNILEKTVWSNDTEYIKNMISKIVTAYNRKQA